MILTWRYGNSFFFRPTPDDSRQVVYPAGKTIAFCKFTRQRGAFSRVLNRLARNTKIVFSPQRGGFSWALCLYDYSRDSICLRDGRST